MCFSRIVEVKREKLFNLSGLSPPSCPLCNICACCVYIYGRCTGSTQLAYCKVYFGLYTGFVLFCCREAIYRLTFLFFLFLWVIAYLVDSLLLVRQSVHNDMTHSHELALRRSTGRTLILVIWLGWLYSCSNEMKRM